MPEPTFAGTGVFVLRPDGKFLLQQRAPGRAGEGLWSVPGGRIDAGETWQETAVREVLEETGIGVADPSLLAVTSDRTQRPAWLTVWSRCEITETPEVRPLLAEVSDWRWVTVTEAHEMPLWAGHWLALTGQLGGWYGLYHALGLSGATTGGDSA